ncbi:unnamed protein product [Somion occarium]|uniref:DUF6593 domain-containing protein n=1 Tax=Somion occarium TaxID=3059160 RepID=A0ABP1DHC5_9APHY
MSTTFGMPFFLEDQSGDIENSEFNDIYNRMRFSLRRTDNGSQHPVLMVYDMTSTSASSRSDLRVPIACLSFGANNALGTVKIQDGAHVDMNQYLGRVGRNPKARKFIAHDGQEYRWTHRPGGDPEWQCVNASGYEVATYSLKPDGEPHYANSSGCVLTVEEAYGHLAGEFLASLTILRHAVKYNYL